MFWRHNIPWLLWATLILALCGLPGDKMPSSSIAGIDKIIHFFIYLVLVHQIIVGFLKQSAFKSLKSNTYKKAVVLGILYGVLIEFLQGTVFSHRSIELADMIANSLGSLAGVASFCIIYKKH